VCKSCDATWSATWSTNGGWLDEIYWDRNTDNPRDLVYLDEILASSPRYKLIKLNAVGFAGYEQAWQKLERGILYLKIDDDVVWLEDDIVPRMVSMKLANPEYLLVSANVANSPPMGWISYHMASMHSYLPELDERRGSANPHANHGDTSHI
jgi:hypothetical protein